MRGSLLAVDTKIEVFLLEVNWQGFTLEVKILTFFDDMNITSISPLLMIITVTTVVKSPYGIDAYS